MTFKTPPIGIDSAQFCLLAPASPDSLRSMLKSRSPACQDDGGLRTYGNRSRSRPRQTGHYEILPMSIPPDRWGLSRILDWLKWNGLPKITRGTIGVRDK